MRTNRLKATLKAGGIGLGTIVWDTRGRGVMHTLAAAGGRICTEHSAFNLETVVGLVAHGAGIAPVVAHYGPAIQARHPIRHRPYSAAPRAERAAQTLAPREFSAAARW